jgi:hypothetical protein
MIGAKDDRANDARVCAFGFGSRCVPVADAPEADAQTQLHGARIVTQGP